MGSHNVLLETNYDLWAIIRVMGPLPYLINLTGRTQKNWVEFYWIRVLMSLIIGPLGNPRPCIINRALLAYFLLTQVKIDNKKIRTFHSENRVISFCEVLADQNSKSLNSQFVCGYG